MISPLFPHFPRFFAAFPRPLELSLGAYFATGHLVAVGSATQLRTSSTSTETSRRVLLGTVERGQTGLWRLGGSGEDLMEASGFSCDFPNNAMFTISHHFYRWYKAFPNEWFIIHLPTLIIIMIIIIMMRYY